ncbi:hypothetical protein ACHAWF_002372, partial [Thalassiosira exigua]
DETRRDETRRDETRRDETTSGGAATGLHNASIADEPSASTPRRSIASNHAAPRRPPPRHRRRLPRPQVLPRLRRPTPGAPRVRRGRAESGRRRADEEPEGSRGPGTVQAQQGRAKDDPGGIQSGVRMRHRRAGEEADGRGGRRVRTGRRSRRRRGGDEAPRDGDQGERGERRGAEDPRGAHEDGEGADDPHGAEGGADYLHLRERLPRRPVRPRRDGRHGQEASRRGGRRRGRRGIRPGRPHLHRDWGWERRDDRLGGSGAAAELGREAKGAGEAAADGDPGADEPADGEFLGGLSGCECNQLMAEMVGGRWKVVITGSNRFRRGGGTRIVARSAFQSHAANGTVFASPLGSSLDEAGPDVSPAG